MKTNTANHELRKRRNWQLRSGFNLKTVNRAMQSFAPRKIHLVAI
jgi:hypothetical protein